MDFEREGKLCSFCGAQGTPELRLVGGLGAMICSICLSELYHQDQDPARIAARSTPPWDSMSNADLLATFPRIFASAEQNAAFALDWVELLRARGCSWTEIGKALGVSRQAAWRRFGRDGIDARRSSA